MTVEFQIVYWRSLPSMVVARKGRHNRHSVELPARFQVAIDELAMRLGITGTDAYLDGWQRSDWTPLRGADEALDARSDLESAVMAAEFVAGNLAEEYPPERVRAMLDDAIGVEAQA